MRAPDILTVHLRSRLAGNGRHLGVAFTEVWGELCPAVEFDSPGACVELSSGAEGDRTLRYLGNGAVKDRWTSMKSFFGASSSDSRTVSARGLLDAAAQSSVGAAALQALKEGSTALHEGLREGGAVLKQSSSAMLHAASPDSWEERSRLEEPPTSEMRRQSPGRLSRDGDLSTDGVAAARLSSTGSSPPRLRPGSGQGGSSSVLGVPLDTVVPVALSAISNA